MNVSKKVKYTISLDDKEAEALHFGLAILDKIIMGGASAKEIENALECTQDLLEIHQDYIIQLFEDLRFAHG